MDCERGAPNEALYLHTRTRKRDERGAKKGEMSPGKQGRRARDVASFFFSGFFFVCAEYEKKGAKEDRASWGYKKMRMKNEKERKKEDK